MVAKTASPGILHKSDVGVVVLNIENGEVLAAAYDDLAARLGSRVLLPAMLARILGQMKYGASVSAVGLAGGANLPATMIPFLLRGVRLIDIDLVMQPYDNRISAWTRLAEILPLEKLESRLTRRR